MSAATSPSSPPGVVLIDPFGDRELADLAEMTGVPVRRCVSWPFDIAPGERVVSTIPVPEAHASEVLGVVVGTPASTRLGERWPDRTVRLREGSASILAHVAGGSEATGMPIAVAGLQGGIGTTTFAAALGRVLVGIPLAVALVDMDPVPSLAARLGLGDGLRWPDLERETGPLLPHRMDAALPVWERVRVLTGGGLEARDGRLAPVVHALACTHDAVVVDVGRDLTAALGLVPEVLVLVLPGEPGPVDLAAELIQSAGGESEVLPVLRAGGVMTAGEVSVRLGTEVVPLGSERGGAAAAAHGERPGDRPRGAVMRAAGLVARRIAERAGAVR